MRKVSVTLPKDGWGTINTKYPADSQFVSVNELTSGSKNFETTDKGVVTKAKGSIDYNSTLLTAAPKDQYEAIFSDGAHHLLIVEGGRLNYSPGDGTFTTVTSGYSTSGNFEFTSYFDRVYFGNGINNPQVYDRATSYGGVSYTAPKTKDMGAQAPSGALTAAVGAGGNVPAGNHTYKVTFLYYDFEESNGGAVSNTVNPGVPSQISLSSIPVGGYGVTARKIYRDDADGVYRLVLTVANNTATTANDNVAAGTTLMPSDNFEPPDFTLILTHLDRIWVAGVPGDPVTVYFSGVGTPDIWPSDNNILCNPRDPITAIVVYQDRIVVFNRNSMGQILGRTTDAFRYAEIPSSVGCVDTRSIQIRVINGVPTLVWLSDKGLYQYNGSSVDYISDPIEDLVNFNIQQAVQTKGRNAQTSQTDFAGGTASAGIDINTFPGLITTKGPKNAGTALPSDPTDPTNPHRVWDSQTEWEAGSSLTNLATKTSPVIKVPVRSIFNESSGAFNNTVLSGGSIVMETSTPFTGASSTGTIQRNVDTSQPWVYLKVNIPRAGSMGNYTIKMYAQSGTVAGPTNQAMVIPDLGGDPDLISGIPGGHPSPTTITTSGTNITFPHTGSLTSGYWWLRFPMPTNTYIKVSFTPTTDFLEVKKNNGLTSGSFSVVASTTEASFGFTYTPVSKSGQWTSTTYDSFSSAAQAATIRMSGSSPAGTSRTIKLQRSSDGTTWTDNDASTFNDNGPHSVAVGNARYWRTVINLSTTDDVFTPSSSDPELRFLTTGEWVSEPLDLSAGVTAYSSLTATSTIPAGTSVTLTAASSADNITYTAFAAIGVVSVQRYLKVKVSLATDSTDDVTSSVSALTLLYTVSGNLVSSAIDTVTNYGWDIFQTSFTTNGGTVTFEMRSATTSGGLGAASYHTVTNGAFPSSVPVNRWVQWRVTLTSAVNDVPEVESVTINWFLNQTSSIRVASLFFNRDYYLSVAEFNQTSNNLLLKYDATGNWRIRRDINVSTMGLFFNDPFFGISTEGQVVKYLQGLVNPDGSNITLDLRTKSFDFSNDGEYDTLEKTKILRSLHVVLTNTGATPSFYASFDGGSTFHALKDSLTGSTTITLGTDGSRTVKRLILDFNNSSISTQGKTIMFRALDSSAADFQLHSLKAKVWLREGELIS